MVNALVYHIASGQAFFSGAALIQLAALSAFYPGGRWPDLCRTVSACAGLILVAVSASPLPAWFYLAAGLVTLAWTSGERSIKATSRCTSVWLRVAVLGIWWLGIALELPFHRAPTVPPMGDPEVFVVGDSLSAGMGGEAESWPKLLSRQHRVVVHDLSLPGANVATALRQAGQVGGPASLVIAEIGGNDILGDTTPDAFERGLDALLAKLRDVDRTIVMLELPLPPFYNRYGAAQRRQAKHHGVLLIPKRLLLGVLTSEGATLDAVHLSRRGHALMAGAIWGLIRRAFEPRGVTTTAHQACSKCIG
jgi:acyl-CoA thioesterase-1